MIDLNPALAVEHSWSLDHLPPAFYFRRQITILPSTGISPLPVIVSSVTRSSFLRGFLSSVLSSGSSSTEIHCLFKGWVPPTLYWNGFTALPRFPSLLRPAPLLSRGPNNVSNSPQNPLGHFASSSRSSSIVTSSDVSSCRFSPHPGESLSSVAHCSGFLSGRTS